MAVEDCEKGNKNCFLTTWKIEHFIHSI